MVIIILLGTFVYYDFKLSNSVCIRSFSFFKLMKQPYPNTNEMYIECETVAQFNYVMCCQICHQYKNIYNNQQSLGERIC